MDLEAIICALEDYGQVHGELRAIIKCGKLLSDKAATAFLSGDDELARLLRRIRNEIVRDESGAEERRKNLYDKREAAIADLEEALRLVGVSDD